MATKGVAERSSADRMTDHNTDGFEVVERWFEFGRERFEVRTLLDRQQYSDPDGEAEALGIGSANWPLFGMMWPSALVLAERVSDLKIDGRRMLEVGCGLGLASLVAKRHGADITATDYHPMVRGFLNHNAARNDLADIPFHRCSWGDGSSVPGHFSLIVASDVCYERGHAESVSAFVDAHAEPDAEVLVVDAGRGHQNRFSRAMVSRGFSLENEQPTPRETPAGLFSGRVLTFRRHG